MAKSSSLRSLIILTLLAAPLSAQQANSSTAGFTIDGHDNAILPLTPTLVAPGSATLEFRGGAHQRFVLFAGAGASGIANLGSIGSLDVDPFDPSFAVWANGFVPTNPIDALAILNSAGARDVTLPLSLSATGPVGTAQCLMMDPSASSGYRLSAANVLLVEPGFGVTSAVPAIGHPLGGETVVIHGEGFVPGAPVVVTFGGIPSPFATVTSSTTIDALSPAGSGTVAISVTHFGLTRSFVPGFSFVTPGANPDVVINEVGTGSPDFVELLNPHPYAVDLSGFKLFSWYHGWMLDGGAPFVIPQGTVLGPGQLLVLQEYGVAGTPGTLPNSLSTGYNFFWVGARQLEVLITDAQGHGVDYVHRRFTGTQAAPNLPSDLSWFGDLLSTGDSLHRTGLTDTDLASDFVADAIPTPGLLNPGQ